MNDTRRYRIVSCLGRGRPVSVYRAEELDQYGKIAKAVALKVFNPEEPAAYRMVERLREVMPRLSLVRYAGIARMEGLVRLGGRWAIPVALFDGVDLREVIRSGPVPALVAVEIVGKVAISLYHALSTPGPDGRPLGLLHGSVQPKNVLVTTTGQVRLLAFGQTGVDPVDGLDRNEDRWDHVAPERWNGVHAPAGEVYAMGTLLFSLLTGQHLGEAARTADGHVVLIESALERTDHLDEGVVALLQSLLAWDAEDRPTVLDVDRQCGELLQGLGGELRRWGRERVPALVRSRPPLEPDELCNTVIEVDPPPVSQVLDEDSIDQASPMDDITWSYPVGVLMQRFGTGDEAGADDGEDPGAADGEQDEEEPLGGLQQLAVFQETTSPWVVMVAVSAGVAIAVVLIGLAGLALWYGGAFG